MAADRFRQRIRWVALHGVIRGLSKFAMRRSGDPQARLIADPQVRADPAAFADELRAQGPVVRCRAVHAGVHQREQRRAQHVRHETSVQPVGKELDDLG